MTILPCAEHHDKKACFVLKDLLFQGDDHTLLLLPACLDVTSDLGHIARVQGSIDLRTKTRKSVKNLNIVITVVIMIPRQER